MFVLESGSAAASSLSERARRVERLTRLRRAARLARAAGQHLRARKLYRLLAGQTAGDGEALHWLGVLELRLGRPAEALAALSRALELDPTSARTHYHYAQAKRAAGQDEQALGHYLAALERAPEMVRAWLGLAGTQLALDRTEEAIQSLEHARRLAPDDREIKALLARACAESAFRAGQQLLARGHRQEADDCYRRALALDPTHDRAEAELARL